MLSILKQKKLYIKDIGVKIHIMVLENLSKIMDNIMKVILNMENFMVKVKFGGLTMILMKENFKMIKKKEKEFLNLQMEIFLLVNLKIINSMVKESMNGDQEIFMKDNLEMV